MNALHALQHIQAGCGYRLVEESPLIPVRFRPEEGDHRGDGFIFRGSIQGANPDTFSLDFIPYEARSIPPISFTPDDFPGLRARLEGTARSRNGQAFMEGKGWSVLVDSAARWKDDVEGHSIWADGLYAPTATAHQFTLESGAWHLIR